MRKLLLTVGLVTTLGLTAYLDLPTPAAATVTCTATCEGGNSLTCTVSTGTCSSASGQVTCCGQTHTCVAIDSWYVCMFECIHGFPPPGGSRSTGPDSGKRVSPIQQNCPQQCGPAPQTKFSC
jgi:hypothetical protein